MPLSISTLGTCFRTIMYSYVIHSRKKMLPCGSNYSFLLFVVCAQLVSSEKESDTVCFNRLGCFSLKEPWKSSLRPISAPMTPEEINTRIYFYNRKDPEKRYEILLHPKVDLNGSPFQRSKPTAVIIHGFASSGNASWMNDLKNSYLSRVDGNAMIVDWGPGSSLFNYLQVAGNTRVVGAEIARMVKAIEIDPKKLHFIGHSLGAHISAYAAKATPNVARITALDPAQPGFEDHDSKVRLDKSDAAFVDVLHTDARPLVLLGFGMIFPVGHVDFYMNGGFDQPGCILPNISKIPNKINSLLDLAKIPVEIIAEMVGCPHGRSYEYFIESLSTREENCVFWGHRVTVPTAVRSVANTVTLGFLPKLTGLPTCSRSDCTLMGLRTKLSALRGSFVVTTRGQSPYCINEPSLSSDQRSILNETGSFFKGAIDTIFG